MNSLFAFVFTKSQALTIPVGLRAAFLGQYVNKYDQLFAASLIFSLPPIALFVGLQRYFVQGIDGWCRKGIGEPMSKTKTLAAVRPIGRRLWSAGRRAR